MWFPAWRIAQRPAGLASSATGERRLYSSENELRRADDDARSHLIVLLLAALFAIAFRCLSGDVSGGCRTCFYCGAGRYCVTRGNQQRNIMSKSTHQLWSEYTARSREEQINGWSELQDALIRVRQEGDDDANHPRTKTKLPTENGEQ